MNILKTVFQIDVGRGDRISQSGLRREQVIDSDDGGSSLEESVEDHKQPQTEEIMNAELKARVSLFFNTQIQLFILFIYLFIIIVFFDDFRKQHRKLP